MFHHLLPYPSGRVAAHHNRAGIGPTLVASDRRRSGTGPPRQVHRIRALVCVYYTTIQIYKDKIIQKKYSNEDETVTAHLARQPAINPPGHTLEPPKSVYLGESKVHFPRYWLFVWGIHRSLVNSPHKGQWRRALMFSLICAWTKGWANNRDAGDLRRHCTHYDVTAMIKDWLKVSKLLLGVKKTNHIVLSGITSNTTPIRTLKMMETIFQRFLKRKSVCHYRQLTEIAPSPHTLLSM